MSLKPYEELERETLKLALRSDDAEKGYPATMPLLEELLRPWLTRSNGQEITACLRRLHDSKQIELWKYQNKSWIKFVPGYKDADFFYDFHFFIRATPLTSPRLQDLEDRERQMTDEELELKFASLNKYGVERVKHDLLNNQLQIVGGTREHRELVWEWVRMKERKAAPLGNPAAEQTSGSRKVFVVHGHDEGAREAVARFLEQIGLEPIILHERANQGRTIIEKVEAEADVLFAVVLLTPDDEGCKKGGSLQPRARQNVVFELGYFVGHLGRNHVCALMRGEVEIPSDFTGVVYAKFDESGGWKQALGRELEAAGIVFDWNKIMTGR